jgi:hypothetical protein
MSFFLCNLTPLGEIMGDLISYSMSSRNVLNYLLFNLVIFSRYIGS